MATAEQHEDICAVFLLQAEDEFRDGDYLQASEKAWGAFSHCMTAIARRRGWAIETHRQLLNRALELINRDPANASERRGLLSSVQSLHGNFYRADMDAEIVQDSIERAKTLIAALNDLNEAA